MPHHNSEESSPLLWLMGPPGGPLLAAGFSRSRRHQRNQNVHKTSGKLPVNQSGLAFLTRLCGAKGDGLFLNYLPRITFNKHVSIFSTSIKAGDDVVLLLKTTSVLLGPLNDAFTHFHLFSEPFSRHQTILPSHSLCCRTSGVSHNPLGFPFFLFCFHAFASRKNAHLSAVCNVFTPTRGHIIHNPMLA